MWRLGISGPCVHQSPIINQQSPINNRLGGGEDISSFLGEKAWGEKEMFVKYRQNKG
jgi:hypothetical protein